MSTTSTTSFEGVRVFRADQRGVTRLPWLDARHSFSFGDHRDPDRMGYSVLRVLNDDVIHPGGGFSEHGHRDMEIVTIVLEGALEHRDSQGNREVLRRGDVQAMTAGSGILHSESNASDAEPVHLLQIWIRPDARGHAPAHATRRAGAMNTSVWNAVASGAPSGDALPIHQDATIAVAPLDAGRSIRALARDGRPGYLHIAEGDVSAPGLSLHAGDAIELAPGVSLTLEANTPAMLVLFDLPAV